MKDVKPIFTCAKANGEAKIVDRILVRILPELIKHGQKMTSDSIDQAVTLEVPNELYQHIRGVAQALTGLTCCDE